MTNYDEVPVFVSEKGIDTVLNLIKQHDRDAFEIVRLTGFKRSTVKYYLTELLNEDQIYRYKLHPERQNSRMGYTIDESKAMEEPEAKVKKKDTIPGARVFLIDEKSNFETLRKISRSQSTKIGKTHPGTSWVHMEMAL